MASQSSTSTLGLSVSTIFTLLPAQTELSTETLTTRISGAWYSLKFSVILFISIFLRLFFANMEDASHSKSLMRGQIKTTKIGLS